MIVQSGAFEYEPCHNKGLGASFLAVMTYKSGDPQYETRDDLLAFLVDGSPKLRTLFSVI